MAETDFLEYANPTRITWTVATQSNKAAALNFPRSVPFILGSNPPPPTLAAAPHPLFLLSPLNIYAGGQVGSNLGKMGGGWWNEMGRGGGRRRISKVEEVEEISRNLQHRRTQQHGTLKPLSPDVKLRILLTVLYTFEWN